MCLLFILRSNIEATKNS